MKKIFNFMLVAMVMLVAACNNTEEFDNIKGESESLSFYAEIANDTRAYIEDENGDKTWSTVWENGDILEVSVVGTEVYNFTYDGEKFTCTETGVNSLKGQTVTIISPSTARNSYAGKQGWAINGTQVENFANSTDPISFKAHTSYFRYTYNGTEDITFSVVLTGKETGVFQDGNTNFYKEITISDKTGENFIAFWTQHNGEVEATLSCSIGGVKIKETTLNLTSGKVYNLGTIAKPAAKVYLVPNADWKSYDAWFAAYFFNAAASVQTRAAATEAWVKMTDEDADGVYECEVAEGFNSVIFCRMNPDFDTLGWDVTEGEGDAFTVVEDHVWSQTTDLTVDTESENSYYYVTGWETGTWGDENFDVNADTPGQSAGLSLIGSFEASGWKTDVPMYTTSKRGISVAESVALKANDSFKIRTTGSWDEVNVGSADVNYVNANSFFAVAQGGGDITIAADFASGNYDVYFDQNNNKVYLMTAGTDYTTATEQTESGKEPEQEEPEVTEKVVYLKPNSNWTQANARFAAYFWNASGNVWVSMTAVGDGTYQVNLPTGYDYGCNVIFCRMNPSTTANNWNNKWNQTADLTTPTDGKNLYTVKDGTWDNGGGTWSTK